MCTSVTDVDDCDRVVRRFKGEQLLRQCGDFDSREAGDRKARHCAYDCVAHTKLRVAVTVERKQKQPLAPDCGKPEGSLRNPDAP